MGRVGEDSDAPQQSITYDPDAGWKGGRPKVLSGCVGFGAPKNLKTISGSKDEGRKSSFCLTDGHLSCEECRIGDKVPKIQRASCTPRRYCKR